MIEWTARAPSGWKSKDGRFTITRASPWPGQRKRGGYEGGWVLRDGTEIVLSPSGSYRFERVQEAKRQAERRVRAVAAA